MADKAECSVRIAVCPEYLRSYSARYVTLAAKSYYPQAVMLTTALANVNLSYDFSNCVH